MTSTEYMAQLEKYLKKLPHKEFQEAITFFNEYFDEADPEKNRYHGGIRFPERSSQRVDYQHIKPPYSN